MPPALCLSPTILDQSFPRTIDELDRATESLGILQGLTQNKRVFILLTSTLQGFHEMFEFQNCTSYARLNDIYRLITQWLLQPTYYLRTVATESVQSFTPHPVPLGCEPGPLIDWWREETGKIYSLCLLNCGARLPVGLACDHAFSGHPVGAYPADAANERFQLVGPRDFAILADFEKWVVPNNLFNQVVSYENAKRNLHVIGGDVAKRPEGSHYKVRFAGAERPWVLDCNENPVQERYLDQLVDLAHLPGIVIRYALIFGELPRREPLF